MKARPLHRSLVFWSGLFVILSIAGAWWSSMTRSSYLAWGKWLFQNAAGSVEVNRMADPSPLRTGRYRHDEIIEKPVFATPLFVKGLGYRVDKHPIKPGEPWTYEKTVIATVQEQAPGTWVLVIPHWQLLLAVLVAWAGAMGWRQKRIRQAGKQDLTGG